MLNEIGKNNPKNREVINKWRSYTWRQVVEWKKTMQELSMIWTARSYWVFSVDSVLLRDINRSGRYGLSPLKAYNLPEKTKLIQGTLVKQMEDVINYEMCSPLRLKFREEES